MPVVAVPAILVIIIALLAVLFLLAWEQFAKSISWVMPSVHIPGFGSLRGWIVSHIKDAFSSVANYLDNYVHPLVVFVTQPVTVVKAFLSTIADTFLDTHSALYAIVTHTIPVAASEARKFAAGLVNTAEAKALSLYHSALNYTHDLVNYALSLALAQIAYVELKAENYYHSSLNYAHDLVNYALSTALGAVAAVDTKAVSLYHSSLNYAHDLAAAVEANTVALYHSLAAAIENRYQQALAFATAAAKAESTAIVNGLNSALVTDIEHAWPLVIAGIDDVIDIAGTDFPDVVADLRNLVRGLPRDLPAAIAASTAIAIPLLRLAKDCTMPNCRNLSQVGRDLQALFSIVESSAIIALLAEAVSNPEGVADTLTSTLSVILNPAIDLVKSEVGIN